MTNIKSFEAELYNLNEKGFEKIAVQLFHHQAVHNPVYNAYLKNLDVDPQRILTLEDIPFLPISFLKTQAVKTGDWQAETVFRSSGTTGMTTSMHLVRDTSFYLQNAGRCFEYFFGPVSRYHIFAILPSYIGRADSSLICMMDHFIRESGSSFSGFYLSDLPRLIDDVRNAQRDKSRKVLIFGVSFALLDLAEQFAPDLSGCLIFETGGMKGRRAEITRLELHDVLTRAFNVRSVYSEYGMTELFSQAYTSGGTRFRTPPWMQVIIREIGDPFMVLLPGKSGGINVVDLANSSTIAFIETEDIGVRFDDGTFEVQGRLDNSDVRGCNLLIS